MTMQKGAAGWVLAALVLAGWPGLAGAEVPAAAPADRCAAALAVATVAAAVGGQLPDGDTNRIALRGLVPREAIAALLVQVRGEETPEEIRGTPDGVCWLLGREAEAAEVKGLKGAVQAVTFALLAASAAEADRSDGGEVAVFGAIGAVKDALLPLSPIALARAAGERGWKSDDLRAALARGIIGWAAILEMTAAAGSQ